MLQPIAQERGVAFIMNDRPDLAAELDCDGVHVGEEDMPYAEARRLLGPDRIVGVTCGASRDRAITAAEAGADYVAFGAFFPSTTKAAKHHADPELLRDWSETTIVPCCAIGGITPAELRARSSKPAPIFSRSSARSGRYPQRPARCRQLNSTTSSPATTAPSPAALLCIRSPLIVSHARGSLS